MLVLAIGISALSVVDVTELNLDHTPRSPPGITPLKARNHTSSSDTDTTSPFLIPVNVRGGDAGQRRSKASAISIKRFSL